MTRKERMRVCSLLKAAHGARVSIEVQEPCKALWIVIEGPNGDWTANVQDAGSPTLAMLLAGWR